MAAAGNINKRTVPLLSSLMPTLVCCSMQIRLRNQVHMQFTFQVSFQRSAAFFGKPFIFIHVVDILLNCARVPFHIAPRKI